MEDINPDSSASSAPEFDNISPTFLPKEEEVVKPAIPAGPEIRPPEPKAEDPESLSFRDSINQDPRAQFSPTPEETQERPDASPDNINQFVSEKVVPTPAQEMPKDDRDILGDIIPRKSGRKLPILPIIAVAVVALIIIGGVFYYLSKIKKATVNVSADQSGIDLVVDGNTYSGITTPYQLSLGKGKHEITAKKEGFLDNQKVLDVSSVTEKYDLLFTLTEIKGMTRILEKEVLYPVYDDKSNALLYFEEIEGETQVKIFNLTTSQETKIAEKLNPVEKASWSPTYRQVAVTIANKASMSGSPISYIDQYGEGTKITWTLDLERKDFINLNTKALNPVLQNIAFSPEGGQIAYLFKSATERDIAVANTDGSNYEILVRLETIKFDPEVAWSPDRKNIAIFASPESSNVENPNVFVYNFESQNAIQLTQDGASSGSLFSPSGKSLLYQSGNSLAIYDLEKMEGEGKSLGLNIPLSLCAWIDSNSFVAFSANDGKLLLVSKDGTSQEINYKAGSLGGSVKSILTNKNQIYFFTDQGVYEYEIALNM